MNEWADALAQSNQDKCEPVPKGWATARQIGEQLGYTANYGRAIVRGMNVESKKFRIMTSRGIYPVVHYRLKK